MVECPCLPYFISSTNWGLALIGVWLYQIESWWKTLGFGILLIWFLYEVLATTWYDPPKRSPGPYDPAEKHPDPTRPREERAGYVTNKLERLKSHEPK